MATFPVIILTTSQVKSCNATEKADSANCKNSLTSALAQVGGLGCDMQSQFQYQLYISNYMQ